MTLYETLKSRLFIMAGPCVIESKDICFEIAERAKEMAEQYGLTYILAFLLLQIFMKVIRQNQLEKYVI